MDRRVTMCAIGRNSRNNFADDPSPRRCHRAAAMALRPLIRVVRA